MKFFCHLLVTCLLLSTLYSCKQKTDYSAEIAKLDSTAAALSERNRALGFPDTSKGYLLTFTQTNKYLAVITEKIKSDTLDKASAIFLSECMEANGSLRNFIENKDLYSKAFTETKKRIDNLKHDLQADLIEQNKAREYLVNELRSSEKLCSTATDMQNKMTAAQYKLDSLQIKLTALADSLQAE